MIETMKNDQRIAGGGVVAHCLVLIFFAVAGLIYQSWQACELRSNAMDLCAWHARRMHGDDVFSETATRRWRSIVDGRSVCNFCGQRHDAAWVSWNAWESQVNGYTERMERKNKGGGE